MGRMRGDGRSRRGSAAGWGVRMGAEEVGWGGRGAFREVSEPAAEALRADGIGGDPQRSLVKWQIVCVDEPVGVGTADGGLGRGWCGTAAYRGEEAGACTAQVGDDVVDDGMVSDEAQDAESAWAG